MTHALTRIVNWGHELLAEKISEGQLTVDLTAGNGYDTLMLHRLVGDCGQVIAFDIQPAALQSTRQRLLDSGATVRMWQAGEFCIPSAGGVDLVEVGHEELQRYLPAAPQGIIANLGYLPGGDRRLVTRPLTTLAALQQSCDLLAPGGRLVVVVYPGHPGGVEEGLAADGFFAALEDRRFQVLQLKVLTRPEAPYLLVAEKCC